MDRVELTCRCGWKVELESESSVDGPIIRHEAFELMAKHQCRSVPFVEEWVNGYAEGYCKAAAMSWPANLRGQHGDSD